jgi:hypothetical protein
LCCIRSITPNGGGGCLPHPAWFLYCRSSFPIVSSWSCQSCHIGHGKMVMVIARPWWLMLVGNDFGVAGWIVQVHGFFGVERNPCRLGLHRCGDARVHHLFFLEGVGCTPFHSPPRTGGKPQDQFGQYCCHCRRIPFQRCCFVCVTLERHHCFHQTNIVNISFSVISLIIFYLSLIVLRPSCSIMCCVLSSPSFLRGQELRR